MMYYSEMKCPKCNIDITEDMIACPNCKRVLKLVCPKCKTINKSNTCRKCGFTIVTKCHNCGKINQTINGKCTNCGFSTYTSVALNTSKINEFACLTVEFPNLDDIKQVFGSTKLSEKFKQNLGTIINEHATELDLTREIIDDVYVIRFNKNDSFLKSAKKAMQVGIEVLNSVVALNAKLEKLKGITLECNVAVLKRDVHSKPDEYKSGLNIRVIGQDRTKSKLTKGLQFITDSYIYEKVSELYDLNSLSASFVKNEMVMFFELKLSKYLKSPAVKEDSNAPKLPELSVLDEAVQDKNDLYDIDAITFNELKSSFINVKSIDLVQKLMDEFGQNRKKIVSVKCTKNSYLSTEKILNPIEKSGFFKEIIRVTCYDEMKYKPYGFFYDLLAGIYNYAQSTLLFANNNFDELKGIDPSGYLKDLINLQERTFPHPEDVRYSLFDAFSELLMKLSNTLIYIENYEKIDSTSLEILQILFENFKDTNISYLIVTNKDFPVHKNSHFLLANDNYCEITVKMTPTVEIIQREGAKYKELLDSFYLKKILQNTRGNLLFFQHSIDYLTETGQIALENNVYSLIKSDNILIPQTLDELILRRLKSISLGTPKDSKSSAVNLRDLFLMLLLIGPRVDFYTIQLLTNSADFKILQPLVDSKHIIIYKNAIYVQNYNLYRENLNSSISVEQKRALARNILEKVYSSGISHPCETTLFNLVEKNKQEFITWVNLSRVNASLGDFSAFLHSSIKFLKLLDSQVSEDSETSIEDYKLEVYENICKLLYKYSPNEITDITQSLLENLEKFNDDKKVINLCNRMLQGCLIGGNYTYALELLHKMLSKYSNYSLNPKDENFNASYFLISLVKTEIMFSIGNLKDCIESGDEILSVLTPDNILDFKPEAFSPKQFEDLLFETMSYVAISRAILLASDEEMVSFFNQIKLHIGKLPEYFNLFPLFKKLIEGGNIQSSACEVASDGKFSKTLKTILKSFSDKINDPKEFADNIYQAKLNAKLNHLPQFELACDLLIGNSYFRLGHFRKAFAIYQNVLDTGTKNGLKLINYIAWYFISELRYEEGNMDIAFGLANNAVVQLEQESNSCDIFLFFFKLLLSKIFAAKEETKLAQLCFDNAEFIKNKYKLNFAINVEIPSKEKKEGINTEEVKTDASS